MKLTLHIIALIISILGVIILVNLYRYTKKHANEELDAHKSYINPRFTAIAVLAIMSGILNLIAVFL